MFWMGGPGWGAGWGLAWGLVSGVFWIALIVVAVLLLRHELPHMHHRYGEPPALRLLEERYARGEITREEFLERREVLLQSPPPPPAPSPPEAGQTEPIPPAQPSA
jgi:putative membrane protein